MRVCVHPLRGESLFPTGLQVSCIETLLAFKARRSASCVPGAGAWVWGAQYRLEPLPPWWEPELSLSSCLLVGHLPGVWVLIMPSLTPYQLFWDSFLCLYLWKIFLASLQTIPMDSCSVTSCNVGGSMVEDELRSFLLYHFGHNSEAKHFKSNHETFLKLKVPLNVNSQFQKN